MAAVEETQFSLLSLEDELSCSICLSPFDCPVTIPCGHNFCQDCLLATWKETYSCPQCRTHFATKPELKKNTVLSAVVETFMVRSNKTEVSVSEEEQGKAAKCDVLCDTCMEARAAQTCLTCMASYCEEHLRPHRENPIFRVHQLSEPMGDLSERICPDHHKLMELFCTLHGRLICSLCLQQVHKSCTFTSPEEQRLIQELDFRKKLDILDEKMTKNETIISQVRDMQLTLKDTATNRKKAVASEYEQIRDMLAQEERDAMNVVDHELESGQTKLRSLMMRLSENISNLSKAKDDIHKLLNQSQTLAFLQASFNMPQAVTFDPYTPRINLDSKKIMATHTFATSLKDHISEILKQPLAARLPVMKTGEKAASATGATPLSLTHQQELEKKGHLLLPNPILPYPTAQPHAQSQTKPEKKKTQKTFAIPPNITSHEKRSELLKYGTVLTFDPKTAHRRIILSEGFTQASVSDDLVQYPECPERFAVCSQVLTSKGFSTGRHYWEVRLSNSNFIGVGFAYRSMDRKGPTSRLGRNPKSWCVEWFNVKLSAWHNSRETVLVNPCPKRVGVLLDCEGGTVTFYNVADRAYPFHTFVYSFTEAVYPAFWIFSNGLSISLCKLQA
ncbi:E3 ubiquitin/ISG15 ligase TRIM25 isoform 2-T2 [Aulostomus maculatus]